MIKRWDIVISGFTQGMERQSGAEVVWDAIRREVAGPERAVQFFTWKSNWQEIAEFIWRRSGGDGEGVVNIYAYSWGGGWGFPKLANELRKREIAVQSAVLCDPVYRSWFLPTWFKFAPLSMTKWLPKMIGWPRVSVPANVGEVYHFYQRNNRPCGHPVKAKDPKRSTVHAGVELLDVTHQYIDDCKQWRELCVRVAKEAEDGMVSHDITD